MNEHLGIARMEASTWAPKPLHLPPLPETHRRALRVSATLTAACALTLAGLLVFARPPVPAYPKAKVVISQAIDANTNLPVARTEWIERTLSK